MQDAEDLFVWTKADRKKLLKAGLDPELIDSLPSRAGALRFIQSEWMSDKNIRSDARKEWKKLSPEGLKLETKKTPVPCFRINPETGNGK